MKRQKLLFLVLLAPLVIGCSLLENPGEIIDSFLNRSESKESKTSSKSSSKNSSKSKESSASSKDSSFSSSSEESLEPSNSSKSTYVPKDGEYDVSSYYDGYYENFAWENGEDLINKLHTVMRKNYYSLSYGWEVNELADRALDDFEYLDVVYSENNIFIDPSTRTTSWNKEHAFCASLMTGTNTSTATGTRGRATDYHNLFASEAKANSTRGNINYGEIANQSSSKGYVLGTKSTFSTFEPGSYDKGRIARALFYMATMYSVDNETPNANLPKLTLKEGNVSYPLNGEGYTEFAHGNLSDLLNWSTYDVDRLEYQHNEMVCKGKINGASQGNRNAYVDFPDLVEYAFGSMKDQPGELKNIIPSAELLEINKEGVANYAISSAKRIYNIGDAFHYSDINLVAVNNDFSNTPVTNFEVDIEEGEILKEGTHEVKIHTDINDITYEIEVGNNYFENATYSHTFVSNDIKKGTDVTLDGLKLNIDWNNTNAKVGNVDTNNGRGIQIGSSSYPTESLTLEVKDSLNNISGIYFKCGVASGEQGVVKFYIDDVFIKSSSVSFISGKAYEAICEVDGNKSGKIKIVFEVAKKASYIHTLAIDYAK